MTTNVTPTIINEGPSKLVVHFLIESDGTDGEINNLSVLDPQTNFTPNLDVNTQLTITQIWYSNIWFDVIVKFNAIQPTTSFALVRDASTYHDFRYFGGLKDRSGFDHDGKVLFSTNGLADNTYSVGTIVIEFKKD